MKSVKHIYFAVCGFGVFLLAMTFLATINPSFFFSAFAFLGIVGMGLLFLAGLILRLSKRNLFGCTMMLPIVCAMFLLVAWYTPSLGRGWMDWQFKKHITEFELIVTDVKLGKIVCTPALRKISAAEVALVPYDVKDIQAARSNDGGVIVLFLTSAAGRIHSGYMYNEPGEAGGRLLQMALPGKMYDFSPIAGNWYRFSDN